MPGPGAQELLRAWELGLDRSPTSRALTLLAVAAPELSPRELAELSIGTRDVGLLRLRARMFGDRVEAVCSCPACGEPLDVSFGLGALLGPELRGSADPMPAPPVRQVDVDDYRVTVRAPSSADLLAVVGEPDAAASARTLLRRLLLEVTAPEGAAGEPDTLPDHVTDALATEIGSLDPYARIELELACAGCGHTWPTLFDVAAFLWTEVHAWAQHLIRDVHTLARAYGWREADILAMSPRRRQGYLELVRG